ncbi:MAG TPA: peptide chain release factor N(5)-glutamine methyltransferase [Usitatibacter sp.]|nr:peptide chain release factor N(5)-glutamine methyltransferase [Usitatibacter sp.]
MMTLKAALDEATASIGRVDAQVLVAHLLGVNSAYLVANPMRVLTESEDARVDLFVAQRALGQPVAYLLGKREFYSRDFEVGPEVLIPRPETETLVEAALDFLRRPGGRSATAGRGPISILDLGTGSGAIAVTLACELPEARIVATDVSDAALATAAANAGAHGCESRIEFIRSAWYEALEGRRFDLIVSNPPYIAARDPHLAAGDLRFEPAMALTDGSADGLDSIRAIASGAPAHLNPGGRLLLEHGYDQHSAVAGVLSRAELVDLASIPDLAGIPRVAGGTLDR